VVVVADFVLTVSSDMRKREWEAEGDFSFLFFYFDRAEMNSTPHTASLALMHKRLTITSLREDKMELTTPHVLQVTKLAKK
jgi:hypothetical protein